MKRAKSITSFILILCMVAGISSVSANYTDVKQKDTYYTPISLLSSLGIIKGYEDGTFGPEKNVTRAEFTVMLMRTLGSSGANANDLNNMPFADVADVVDWAGGDIKSAYGLGIINGVSKDTFAPNDEVTFEQALKMIVCALGYEPMATDKVGGDKSKVYPNGYLTVATTLKIDKDLSVKINTPAKRWEIAQMLYNSLEIKLMKGSSSVSGINYDISDETILSDKLDIKYGFGVIRANDKESIENGKICHSGEVLILPSNAANAETFYAGNVDTTGLVGQSVKYYYKESDTLDKTLVYVESKTKDSSIVKIDTKDIDSVSGTWKDGFTVYYWENDKARTTTQIDVKKESSIAVNGRAVSEPEAGVLRPNSGFIEVIDSNNDGDYDSVNVTSYETYVVSTVNSFDNQVSDMYRPSTDNKIVTIDLNDVNKNVSIIDADKNQPLTFSDISKWSVLSIKESNSLSSKDVMEVYVSKKTVEGTITSIDTSDYNNNESKVTVTIDGKEYILSDYYKKYCTNYNFQVSDSGTFYLDMNGEICAFDKTKSKVNQYGYLSGVQQDIKSGRLLLNILPVEEKDPVTTAIKSASRVSLDGTSYSDPKTLEDQIVNISASNSLINVDGKASKGSQLILYSLNSEGEVKSIDTVSDGGTLTPYKNNSNNYWSFMKMSSSFEDANGNEFFMNSDTKVVYVPSQSRDMYEDYTAMPYKSSMFDKDDSYTLEAYDVDGTPGFASVVVVYKDSLDTPIGKKSPVAIITDIKSVIRPDGENSQLLTAYVVGKDDKGDDTSTFYTESADTLDNFAVGDVIRFATTKEGYIKDGAVQMQVDVNSPTIDPFYTNCQNEPLSNPTFIDFKDATGAGFDYRVVHGLLYAATEGDQNIIEVVPVGDKTKDAVESAMFNKYSFSTSKNTRFFTYDASLPINKVAADGNSLPLSGYPSYVSAGETGSDYSAQHATEIYTYECEADVYVVYVIKR